MTDDETCKLDAMVAAILAAGQHASAQPPTNTAGATEHPVTTFRTTLSALRAQGGASTLWLEAKP